MEAYREDQLFVLTAHDDCLREKIERLLQELDVAAKERSEVFISTDAIGREE